MNQSHSFPLRPRQLERLYGKRFDHLEIETILRIHEDHEGKFAFRVKLPSAETPQRQTSSLC